MATVHGIPRNHSLGEIYRWRWKCWRKILLFLKCCWFETIVVQPNGCYLSLTVLSTQLIHYGCCYQPLRLKISVYKCNSRWAFKSAKSSGYKMVLYHFFCFGRIVKTYEKTLAYKDLVLMFKLPCLSYSVLLLFHKIISRFHETNKIPKETWKLSTKLIAS